MKHQKFNFQLRETLTDDAAAVAQEKFFDGFILSFFFTTYFPNSAPIPVCNRWHWLGFAASLFEPTVELLQTETFEGRSTDWATAPRH